MYFRHFNRASNEKYEYWRVLNSLVQASQKWNKLHSVCIEHSSVPWKTGQFLYYTGWLANLLLLVLPLRIRDWVLDSESVSREFLNTIRSSLLQSTEHFSMLTWAHSLALVIKQMISMLAAPNEWTIAVSYDWHKRKHALLLFSLTIFTRIRALLFLCDGLMMEHGEYEIQNEEYELQEQTVLSYTTSLLKAWTAGCGNVIPLN